MYLRTIDRNGGTDNSSAEGLRQADFPLHDEQRGAARAGNGVLVYGAAVDAVCGQRKSCVPERARAKGLSGRLHRQLPVKTAERLLEAGLRRGLSQLQRTIPGSLQAAHELPQMGLQFHDHAPFHMPLEQKQETEAGEREDEKD